MTKEQWEFMQLEYGSLSKKSKLKNKVNMTQILKDIFYKLAGFKKYRFIGEDGSMGLKFGEYYWIKRADITPYTLYWVYVESEIYPYESLGSFLMNWEDIK